MPAFSSPATGLTSARRRSYDSQTGPCVDSWFSGATTLSACCHREGWPIENAGDGTGATTFVCASIRTVPNNPAPIKMCRNLKSMVRDAGTTSAVRTHRSETKREDPPPDNREYTDPEQRHDQLDDHDAGG